MRLSPTANSLTITEGKPEFVSAYGAFPSSLSDSMQQGKRTYISIDLKSFFASVECVERGLPPLTTNLVVADLSRTEKTVCLAVTPSLKAYGIAGRARLFEVVQRVREVNRSRAHACGHPLAGKSWDDVLLREHPEWQLDYIVAPPRMACYMRYSRRVYETYLKYVSPEDIHAYSIDEVFMDVTAYLGTYRQTARQLAQTMIRDVLHTTGITATAGIGSNLYLAKVAMDIVAKHIPADKDGVRIAELDEMSYRQALWGHRPITDFWRVGRGIARKLEMYGMYTMGDVARRSVHGEELLYQLFGVNAELLIDHAWGWEPCPMSAIKSYRSESSSLSSGQVLQCPYTWAKARVVVHEMAEAAALELLDKGLVTDQLVLYVGYDIECLTNAAIRAQYHGEVHVDHYGRPVPKPAHGSCRLEVPTSSSSLISRAVLALYDRIVDRRLLVRRLNLTSCHVLREDAPELQRHRKKPVQLDLFTDYEQERRADEEQKNRLDRERRMQQAVLKIKKRFGKNAILKGLSFEEGATARERNRMIGGHSAGRDFSSPLSVASEKSVGKQYEDIHKHIDI